MAHKSISTILSNNPLMQNEMDTSINLEFFIYVDWFDSNTSRSLFKKKTIMTMQQMRLTSRMVKMVNTLSSEDNYPGSSPGFGFVCKYRVLSLFSS